MAREDDLNWLTEEELEGLDDDDLTPGSGVEGADDDEGDDGQAAAASSSERASARSAGQDGGHGADQKPGAQQGQGPDGGEEEAPLAPFQPVYQASLPQDFAERVKALEDANRELAVQYEQGEFDLVEFGKRQKVLHEQEWALRGAALKAELAREQQAQSMAQRWTWEQEAYFRKPENRAFRDDPVISHAFEGAIKLLAADEANENRDMAWFLEEAGRLARARVRELAESLNNPPGRAAGAGGTRGGQGAGAGTQATGKGAGQMSRVALPPSLGGVPTAAMPDPGGDEFAYLDRLSGLDAERALSKLTPEQLDRYLTSQ